jgi:MSHA biogenesis protein MshP
MTRHHFHQGFAAIAAIFLLVVLAALAAFMLTFSNTAQLTSAQDTQGTRAYWAARAGLEWAIVNNAAVCTGVQPTPSKIEGFSVTITCLGNSFTDDAPINVFKLTSVASAGGAVGSTGYIERSVSVSVCRTQAAPYDFC